MGENVEVLYKKEIDFVAIRENEKIYVQVANNYYKINCNLSLRKSAYISEITLVKKKGRSTWKTKTLYSFFLARNEQAINKTQEKYSSRIRKLAYELTEDMNAAEECENDTYLQAWNSIPPNEPYDYFYSFLVRIVRHIALNFCRDRNRLKRKATISELSVELEQIIPGNNNVEYFIDEMALQGILNNFLGTLSQDKRKIFIRRYWYLDSIRTISDGYGISKSKVKVILFRCREQLRTVLEKEGYNL